jgi:hypothetical protein
MFFPAFLHDIDLIAKKLRKTPIKGNSFTLGAMAD